MVLKREEVRKVAVLARLDLSGEEEAVFAEQLSQVVEYFDQLQEFDTAASDDETGEVGPIGRPDEVAESLPRRQFLDNAPRSRDGFLLVPQVKVLLEDTPLEDDF